MAAKPAWATPVLIALGLATSLAETLGITLIVAFLYSAMGQSGRCGCSGRWHARPSADPRAWRLRLAG